MKNSEVPLDYQLQRVLSVFEPRFAGSVEHWFDDDKRTLSLRGEYHVPIGECTCEMTLVFGVDFLLDFATVMAGQEGSVVNAILAAISDAAMPAASLRLPIAVNSTLAQFTIHVGATKLGPFNIKDRQVEQLPDWFLLIHAWKAKGLGDRGLTLPFLVGARALASHNAKPALTDASLVLNEMIASPVNQHVTEISWCHEIQAPVFFLRSGTSQFIPLVGFKSPAGDGYSLVFSTELQDRWNSKAPWRLLAVLFDESNGPITGGLFSRDGHSQAYRSFESWEEKFILATLGRG